MGQLIALAGDWHGDAVWARRCLARVAAYDVTTLLHVGDLGFGRGDGRRRYLDDVDSAAAGAGLTILVTPGNHDDWAALEEAWADPRHRGADGVAQPIPLTEHVHALPRGHRWSLGGRTFVSLGGAASVNIPDRIEGVNWWPQEVITDDDVDRVVAGGPADVMVTHETPSSRWSVPAVVEALATNPMGLDEPTVAYSRHSRSQISRALLAVRPRLLVHGHMHLAGETRVRLPGADHDTTVRALDTRRTPGNLRLLDLDTLTSPPSEDLQQPDAAQT